MLSHPLLFPVFFSKGIKCEKASFISNLGEMRELCTDEKKWHIRKMKDIVCYTERF